MMEEARFLSELEQLKKKLFNFARRSLYNPAEAEDVLSEAVLSAWTERERFADGTNFSAWIFQILLNKIYAANRRSTLSANASRQQARETSMTPTDSIESVDVLLRDPAAVLDRCSDDLKRALAALNESEREAFLLLSLGEMSYAEIATLTSSPLGTVVTRLTRARLKMRGILQKSSRQAPTARNVENS